jgi:hypothetical protein
MLRNNHGSLNQLSKSDVMQTDSSDKEQNVQDGYRVNYIDVTYNAGQEMPQLTEKYELKDGSEVKINNPPLKITPDRIINTPRRKCPSGQKLDTFGTCKTVWNS